MTRKHKKDWNPGDPDPNSLETWEELTDRGLVKLLDATMESNVGMYVNKRAFLILQRRENKRSNRRMTWLVAGTLVFTAISAVFVALSVYEAI